MHRFNATFVFIMSIVAFIAFLILFGLSFAGCGTMNAYTSAALVTAGSDYEGAKKNLQDLDDIKFKAWVDMAATIPAGALQRGYSFGTRPPPQDTESFGNGRRLTSLTSRALTLRLKALRRSWPGLDSRSM